MWCQQRAQRRFDRRRGRRRLAGELGGGEAAREQTDRGALDIAFAAGDLAGEADVRARLEPERRVEQLGRLDEGVAVQAAEPRELGIFQPGDGAEQLDLLGIFELGLEADDVPQRAAGIVLAELDDRIGPAPGARIVEADALHRAEAQGVDAALGHHFDRHAAFEIGDLLPLAELGLLAGEQPGVEGEILVLRPSGS